MIHDGGLVVQISRLTLGAGAPEDDAGPTIDCVTNVAVHLYGDAWIIERAHGRTLVQWMSELHSRRVRNEAIQHLVVDAFRHKNSFAALTDLAGIGEADGVRAGAGHDLLTRNRPSMDQIDRPLRQTCLKKALNQASRDHRGRRCRLPNNNIACGERSRQVLARDTNWIVPGSQDGDYSVRLAQRKDSLAGRRWQQGGLQLGNVLGCIAEELRCEIDLVNGFAQWLTLLQRELWRQARLAGQDGVGYPVAQSSTFENRETRARMTSPVGRVNGC